MTSWSDMPVWRFCEVDTTVTTSHRYAVKIVDSVESPFVDVKRRDGPLVIRTLVNTSQRLVGYSFTFTHDPSLRDFGYSLAASYGVPDTEDIMLVLGSPHLRVLRSGKDNPVYHVVLRHK